MLADGLMPQTNTEKRHITLCGLFDHFQTYSCMIGWPSSKWLYGARLAPGGPVAFTTDDSGARAATVFMMFSALVAILTTAGIVFSLLYESWQFFRLVPVHEFLFGMRWEPQIALRADQVGQSGAFGAVLMRAPDLVAECAAAMIAAAPGTEITVKCRIGVDEQEPREVLPRFLEAIREAGVRRVAIHARKAWLQGLSPKENRDVPPLDYPLVMDMKRAFPDLHVSINGGIGALEEARAFLDQGLDGVMIGRAAYHTPADLLGPADPAIWGRGRIRTCRGRHGDVCRKHPYTSGCIGRHHGAVHRRFQR